MTCTRVLCEPIDLPSQARDHTRSCLTSLGAGTELTDDAVLAVSELAANAHEHATGPVWMQIWTALGWAFVHVNDSSPHARVRLPRLSELNREWTLDGIDALEGDLSTDQSASSRLGLAERSRGLGIVATLSAGCYGVAYGAECKAVWFALRLHHLAPKAPPLPASAPILVTPKNALIMKAPPCSPSSTASTSTPST